MGLEAECEVTHAGQEGAGKAHLESKHISFRGPFRFKIPFAEIETFEVRGDTLELETEQGAVTLQLGAKLAQRWCLKLRYPKTLIDKLGVKDDHTVSTTNVVDKDFWKFLRHRTDNIAKEKPQSGSDYIFLQVESVEELDQLAQLEWSMKRNGAIWVLWPKGQKHIKQSDVMAASKQAGMVDVKVVSFSERLSGLKLMIPVVRR